MREELDRFNRFGALAAHIVVHGGRKKADVVQIAIDYMGLLRHHFDKAVRVATIRATQTVL
jgi:hypothetical protein